LSGNAEIAVCGDGRLAAVLHRYGDVGQVGFDFGNGFVHVGFDALGDFGFNAFDGLRGVVGIAGGEHYGQQGQWQIAGGFHGRVFPLMIPVKPGRKIRPGT
jgi:hypothetical protein